MESCATTAPSGDCSPRSWKRSPRAGPTPDDCSLLSLRIVRIRDIASIAGHASAGIAICLNVGMNDLFWPLVIEWNLLQPSRAGGQEGDQRDRIEAEETVQMAGEWEEHSLRFDVVRWKV
jgi:hypothetical protein